MHIIFLDIALQLLFELIKHLSAYALGTCELVSLVFHNSNSVKIVNN